MSSGTCLAVTSASSLVSFSMLLTTLSQCLIDGGSSSSGLRRQSFSAANVIAATTTSVSSLPSLCDRRQVYCTHYLYHHTQAFFFILSYVDAHTHSDSSIVRQQPLPPAVHHCTAVSPLSDIAEPLTDVCALCRPACLSSFFSVCCCQAPGFLHLTDKMRVREAGKLLYAVECPFILQHSFRLPCHKVSAKNQSA